MRRHIPLLILGGGMAAMRLLQRLDALGYAGEALIVSDEAVVGYNRVLLPNLVAGECDESDLLAPLENSTGSTLPAWCQGHCGQVAIDVDLTTRHVKLADGAKIGYETLVFATGSRVASPEILSKPHSQIMELRRLDDARRLSELPADVRSVVVVGGGLLGLEAANALQTRGYRVVVIHRQKDLMNRQLEGGPANRLRTILVARGMEFSLEAEVSSLKQSAGKLTAVVLSNGSSIDTQLVLVATGNRANDELAAAAGLACNNGIAVGRDLLTQSSNVYALGECARVDGQHYCFVEPVYAQADVLARRLCGQAAEFQETTTNCRLKVAGVELFCAGSPDADASDSNEIVVDDPQAGIYRRLAFAGKTLHGVTLLGSTFGAAQLLEAVGTTITDSLMREQLAFGISTNHDHEL